MATKARILAICSSDKWAGTEKWVTRACENLLARGHDVRLVARCPEVFEPRLERDLPLYTLPMRNEADLISVFRMYNLIMSHADIVIPTRVRDYWLAGMAARLAGKPLLLRLGVVRRLRDNYIMDVLRYGRFPNGILVNAQAIMDELVKTPWIDPRRVHIIYNGVNVPGALEDGERNKIRAELNISKEDVLIIGAGRLAVEKRWDWLIKALVEIRGRLSKTIKVFIFGEGNERSKLEELLADTDLGSTISLPGQTDRLDEYFGAADLAVLPSSNEGLSNVMLEAMGRKVPVLVTESGGLKERFTDGSDVAMVERNDFDGFCGRLFELCENLELRLNIGWGGYKNVLDNFSWRAMTDSLEQLIQKVINENK